MTTRAAEHSITELASAYAASRSDADLAALRAAVRASAGFDVGLDVVGEVAGLMARGAHQDVVDRVHALMPGAFFSPAAHAALGAAYAALGDADRAHAERRRQTLALEAIRSSGDGTRERPWTVLRVSDEYDLLRAERKVSREQSLVTASGRSLDRHVCEDGTQVWFDASDLT